MNHFDARVRYTRMIIDQCFLELLTKKHFSRITVTELCTMAQINRATFYKHYQDVPQLLETMCDQILQQIHQLIQEHAQHTDKLTMPILRYICDHAQTLKILGSSNADPELMAKIYRSCFDITYPDICERLPDAKEEERQMLYSFLSSGSAGILSRWMEQGMKQSPEAVSEILLQFTSAAVQTLL